MQLGHDQTECNNMCEGKNDTFNTTLIKKRQTWLKETHVILYHMVQKKENIQTKYKVTLIKALIDWLVK